ncbi:hypothetical protein WDW86_16040 [Bdellovibrionota bacterium FG-2]
MNVKHLFQSCKFQRVSIEAAALMALILCFESAASSAQGWQGQPSWASDPPVKKSVSHVKYDSPNISPFSPGSNNLGLDLGQVFLMGDLDSNYQSSIGTRLHYTYGVSDLFGFDSSLGFSDHSEGKFSMTTVLSGARMNLAWYDKVIPYVNFGFGFFRPSYELSNKDKDTGEMRTTSVSPLLFGVYMGPGLDLELNQQVFFGASLTFHDAFGTTKTTPNGPMEVGGTFTSLMLRAGVTF